MIKKLRRLGRWQPKYHADVKWYNNKYLSDEEKETQKIKNKKSIKNARQKNRQE